MLKGIAWRLGFIFCLALTARIIGGFFAPDHPPAPRFREDMTAGIAGDLLPTSPEMRRAIAQVQAAGVDTEGARLTYGQGADSVTATPRQLAAARAMVRRQHDAIDGATEAAETGEKPGTVSFEPGQPMIDPNPDAH